MLKKQYQAISLVMMFTFAAVGLVFLFLPTGTISFFNTVSARIGMVPAPEIGADFFLILACGYMYLVTLLAFLMFRDPGSSHFPLLLANAKLASSLLSLGMFLLHQPYLIFITNCVVDGGIGFIALMMYRSVKKGIA